MEGPPEYAAERSQCPPSSLDSAGRTHPVVENTAAAGSAGISTGLELGPPLQHRNPQLIARSATGYTVFMLTSKDEAAKLLTTALQAIPTLTHYGIGIYDQATIRREQGRAAVEGKLAEGREKLKRELEQIAVCADWIKHLTPTKAINPRHSSYGLKHCVEEWSRTRADQGEDVLTYVTNGAFIAAAVGLGFRFKYRETPNPAFNFSDKSLKAAVHLARPDLRGSTETHANV